jgi:hypothetical protein
MGRSPFAFVFVFAFALAPVVVGAALVLQTAPTLPSPTARAAAFTVACGLVLLAWRAGARAPRLAALLVLAAIGAATWAGAAWRAVDRLDERLAPALEGVDLTLTGVVDELPIAVERGQRFALRVERCERRGSGRSRPLGGHARRRRRARAPGACGRRIRAVGCTRTDAGRCGRGRPAGGGEPARVSSAVEGVADLVVRPRPPRRRARPAGAAG